MCSTNSSSSSCCSSSSNISVIIATSSALSQTERAPEARARPRSPGGAEFQRDRGGATRDDGKPGIRHVLPSVMLCCIIVCKCICCYNIL